MIAHLLKLQQKYFMAWTVQNKLGTPNVNVYSGHSGEIWSEVEGILHYNFQLYISKILRDNMLEENYDDALAGYFRVEKTLEL